MKMKEGWKRHKMKERKRASERNKGEREERKE